MSNVTRIVRTQEKILKISCVRCHFVKFNIYIFSGFFKKFSLVLVPGVDLGGGCRGCAPPPKMTCGFLIQLVFCKKIKKLCGLLVLK